MNEYISFDSHKKYTLAERMDRRSLGRRQKRIEHEPGAIREYLSTVAPGTSVAVEAIGHWYWIIEEIEAAGMKPLLVHPRKAKLMMGMINKTDKLDVHGLNRLQQNQTLPTVWIAPRSLRDLRELTRLRLQNTRQRTRLKNRITATLEKYALRVQGCSDAFGVRARQQYPALLAQLPPQTQWSAQLQGEQLELVERHIAEQESRLKALIKITPTMQLLMTIPGIGVILAATIALEVGRIERFATDEHLASYAGTTPRVHSSGGKTWYGRTRPDVNRYLKWAFHEAANSVALNHKRRPDRHVSIRYRTLKARKSHSKAVGAVARHLAEAVWHVWTRKEPYRDPTLASPRKPKREVVMPPLRGEE